MPDYNQLTGYPWRRVVKQFFPHCSDKFADWVLEGATSWPFGSVAEVSAQVHYFATTPQGMIAYRNDRGR